MDRVLRPHAEYVVAYLCDVIIHSDTWPQHLRRVAAVLKSLRRAVLTANPKKCVNDWREVWYLALAACLRPAMKKQVRAFLGMANY